MSVFRLTIGIDPGKTGCIAVLADGEFERVVDMPVMARPSGGNEINGTELARGLREIRAKYPGANVLVCLEQVNAMPSRPGPDGQRRGMGSASAFNFGEGFGVVKGVIAALGVPVLMVHPQKWKKLANLIGREKDVARTLAIQRFPTAADQLKRKKDIGRADALLIAQWAYVTEQVQTARKAA